MDGELAFEVEGYPPGKNEALSLFNEAHGQAAASRRLLEAARSAIGWRAMPLFRGPVVLEVTCEAAADRQPWDATNYLGGIADVLEDKSRRQRNALAHLGDLAAVCVYVNDRQIKEIRYREIEGPGPRYQVRIWPLDRSR